MRRFGRSLALGAALLGLLSAGCQRSVQRCPCGDCLAVGSRAVNVLVEPPPPPVAVETAPAPSPEQPALPPEPGAVPPPAPKRTTLPSAHSRHAPDYSWLLGELQYAHVRGAWCVHYAPPDEDDPHGGTVTLVDPGPMTGFRSGQFVRVEGSLVDPASLEPSPAYRVRSIQPASRP
jgi:hypothetical protein